ncbi:hypothetical protein RKD20_000024 [Streptomyces sp. SLBN-8D4]
MTSPDSRNHTRPSEDLPLHIHPLLEETDVSIALDHHTPQTFVDPYAGDPAESAWPPAAGQDTNCLLPPPNPAERLSIPISPRDQRRLALHAALTVAGIPPRPEDRDAIDQLSTLSPSIDTALQRWLSHTS